MKLPFCLVAFAFCVFLISSCKSTYLISEESSSEQIGPEGGTITSADGKLTLTFPAGALSQFEMITLEKIDPESLGPEFDEIRPYFTIKAAYELSPDGLTFNERVHTTMHSNQKATERDGIIELEAEIPFTSSGGVLKVLENPGIVRNTDGSVITHGDLRSFSRYANTIERKALGHSVALVSEINIEEKLESNSLSTVNSSITIRGTNSNSAVIYIDGVRVTQGYGPSLSNINPSDIEAISVYRTDNNIYNSDFNYNWSESGIVNIVTKSTVNFSKNHPNRILRNTDFSFENKQLLNLTYPQTQDPDYNFEIVNLDGELNNDMPGYYSLYTFFNIHPDISENSFFFLNWDDGNMKYYEPTEMETTWGHRGSSDIWEPEDTHVFKASHQYNSSGAFNINVQALAYSSPNPQDDNKPSYLFFTRRLANRWMLRSNMTNNDWEWGTGTPKSFKDIYKELSPSTVNGLLGIDKTNILTTADNHLTVDFPDVDQSTNANPIISIDKITLDENSMAYNIDFSNDLRDRYSSLNLHYNYKPGDNNSDSVIDFDLDLSQNYPIIIQTDSSGNSFIFNDLNGFTNSYNQNLPTTFITTSEFLESIKIYDQEETTVQIPGYTLDVKTEGNGSGSIAGRIVTLYPDSDFPDHIDIKNAVLVSNNMDEEDLVEFFRSSNENVFTLGNSETKDFLKNTEIAIYPVPDLGSVFVGYSNEIESFENGISKIKIGDNFTLRPIFNDTNEEDQDPSTDQVLSETDPDVQNEVSFHVEESLKYYSKFGITAGLNRYSFEDEVSNQTDLTDYVVDKNSLAIGIFAEYDFSSIEAINNAIGPAFGFSGGVSYRYNDVKFSQTFEPITQEQNLTDGSIDIHEATVFATIKEFVQFKLFNMGFDPYLKAGGGIIWNNATFKLNSFDGSQETHRRNHRTAYPFIGIGTDIGIYNRFGIRLSSGRTFGVGGDNNWGFNISATYDFCRSNKSDANIR